MTLTAIIGGSGLTELAPLAIIHREAVPTPFGDHSAALSFGTLAGRAVVFLARHGDRHTYPPHRLNYRANIWALKHAGADRVLAVATVGGITSELHPGRLAVPDQVIDYTFGRAQTFFEDDLDQVTHVDFTHPFDSALRQSLIHWGRGLGLHAAEGGTYGAMQGPRLETAAEIRRLERDGCDVVGMTLMPEAALARELDLPYAACNLVVNWAAGKGDGIITMEDIRRHQVEGLARICAWLEAVVRRRVSREARR